MTEDDLLEILESHTGTLAALGEQQLVLAAQLGAAETGLRILAKKLGVRDDLLFEQLRKLQANLHQKLLEDLEDRNPAAAARVRSQPASDLFDQKILDILGAESPAPDGPAAAGESQEVRK